MHQPSLFDPPPPEPRPPDPNVFRRHLNAALSLLRRADFMPWHDFEVVKWTKDFQTLTRHLPAEEAEAMKAEFARQLSRLSAAE